MVYWSQHVDENKTDNVNMAIMDHADSMEMHLKCKNASAEYMMGRLKVFVWKRERVCLALVQIRKPFWFNGLEKRVVGMVVDRLKSNVVRKEKS